MFHVKQQAILLNGLPTPFLADLLAELHSALPGVLRFDVALLASARHQDAGGLQQAMHFCLPALLQAGQTLLVAHAWSDTPAKRELLTELAGYEICLLGVHQQEDSAGLHEGFEYDGSWDAASCNDPALLARRILDFLPEAGSAGGRLSLQGLL